MLFCCQTALSWLGWIETFLVQQFHPRPRKLVRQGETNYRFSWRVCELSSRLSSAFFSSVRHSLNGIVNILNGSRFVGKKIFAELSKEKGGHHGSLLKIQFSSKLEVQMIKRFTSCLIYPYPSWYAWLLIFFFRYKDYSYPKLGLSSCSQVG